MRKTPPRHVKKTANKKKRCTLSTGRSSDLLWTCSLQIAERIFLDSHPIGQAVYTDAVSKCQLAPFKHSAGVTLVQNQHLPSILRQMEECLRVVNHTWVATLTVPTAAAACFSRFLTFLDASSKEETKECVRLGIFQTRAPSSQGQVLLHIYSVGTDKDAVAAHAKRHADRITLATQEIDLETSGIPPDCLAQVAQTQDVVIILRDATKGRGVCVSGVAERVVSAVRDLQQNHACVFDFPAYRLSVAALVVAELDNNPTSARKVKLDEHALSISLESTDASIFQETSDLIRKRLYTYSFPLPMEAKQLDFECRPQLIPSLFRMYESDITRMKDTYGMKEAPEWRRTHNAKTNKDEKSSKRPLFVTSPPKLAMPSELILHCLSLKSMLDSSTCFFMRSSLWLRPNVIVCVCMCAHTDAELTRLAASIKYRECSLTEKTAPRHLLTYIYRTVSRHQHDLLKAHRAVLWFRTYKKADISHRNKARACEHIALLTNKITRLEFTISAPSEQSVADAYITFQKSLAAVPLAQLRVCCCGSERHDADCISNYRLVKDVAMTNKRSIEQAHDSVFWIDDKTQMVLAAGGGAVATVQHVLQLNSVQLSISVSLSISDQLTMYVTLTQDFRSVD